MEYHLWKEILPLTLIVFMSWAVFWIDPNQLGAQIAVSSSSVLTLIAFLFSLGELLPQVPYLTRMDHFIYGSVVLVFMAFAEGVLTCTMSVHGAQAQAQRIDHWARWMFPAAFAVLLIVAFLV